MSFKLPVLYSVKVSLRRSTAGLPEFQWSDLSEKDEIGRGAFGSVLIACHGTSTEKVVVKKLIASSRADEKQRFFKEARLLKKLRHKNVVEFKMVCIEPPAIMLEYVYFDFSPFCPDSHRVNSLEGFLSHLDATDAVANFPSSLQLKIAEDAARGLEHLHQSGIYHRDLKTSNVLVSNIHYCHLEDEEELVQAFNREPIVCKLADFGESRSDEIQTHLMANTRTENVNRGTPSFMAPEIKTMVDAGADDLQRIDMWAYGMVVYCILNPDAKFPFYFDAKDAREKSIGPQRFDVLKFVEEKLENQQKPTHSCKYHQFHQTQEWRTLLEVYEGCTAFRPIGRLTAIQAINFLSNSKHFDIIPLALSQNSALERFDRMCAAGLASSGKTTGGSSRQQRQCHQCLFIYMRLSGPSTPVGEGRRYRLWIWHPSQNY